MYSCFMSAEIEIGFAEMKKCENIKGIFNIQALKMQLLTLKTMMWDL